MLVYANNFSINPQNGVFDVVEQIAIWIGSTWNIYVDPDKLSCGIKEYRVSDRATLSSCVTLNDDNTYRFPYFFCAKFQHPDSNISGRRWTTEIGIQQVDPQGEVYCSILLRAEEASVRVIEPVNVTRPRIVEFIFRKCRPVNGTPGLKPLTLTIQNASDILAKIEDVNRKYPLIICSHPKNESALFNVKRLQNLTIGLAQVIEIPKDEDTFKIEEILSRKYTSFGGAINIIFPVKKVNEGQFCNTILILRENQIKIKENCLFVENEILSIITHRTNVPNSWGHISSDSVRQELLRFRLRDALGKVKVDNNSIIYEELLKEASETIDAKDGEIKSLRLDVGELSDKYDLLKADVESLRHALDKVPTRSASNCANSEFDISVWKEYILRIMKGSFSLTDILFVVSKIFSNNLIVLDTAFQSAKDSDRNGFSHKKKAIDLLLKLATTYWEALNEGKGDQEAKSVFGRGDYAAKEASTLSRAGRSRRTFTYRDHTIFMEKHLKHGVKDSASETLRIHFEWIETDKKIVIGYCGEHLDF